MKETENRGKEKQGRKEGKERKERRNGKGKKGKGRGKKGWKERATIEGKKPSFSKAIESISVTWYGATTLSTSNAISDISISFDCLYCFHAFISHLITYSFRQTCVKAINFTLLTETKETAFSSK